VGQPVLRRAVGWAVKRTQPEEEARERKNQGTDQTVKAHRNAHEKKIQAGPQEVISRKKRKTPLPGNQGNGGEHYQGGGERTTQEGGKTGSKDRQSDRP